MSAQQDPASRVERLIAPSIDAMDYELVRVRLMGGQRRPTLQVMAERVDRTEMTVDDCAAISRAVSVILDVEDPIAGAFELEVSSPGIDRPLVKADDFERFAGHEAKLETVRPVDGRRRFRGRLLGLRDGMVRIALGAAEAGDEPAEIPFAEVAEAKLILTDALIRESLKGRGR